MLSSGQAARRYYWPTEPLLTTPGWEPGPDGTLWRRMPEAAEDVAADSRWPSFFPSPICLVTTGDEDGVALEKVVGPSIVNRFPYVRPQLLQGRPVGAALRQIHVLQAAR